MKACRLHAVGDLRFEDAPMPVAGPGEALIAVKACGVCGSDVPRVFEKGTYRFPTIPGHEFAGDVVAGGCAEDASWAGKRVTVFPLISCRRCAPCEIGAFAQCEDYDYLGSRRDGAFAEVVCAPVSNLVPIPDNVSFEEAAMAEPAAVAVHALRQAGVEPGDAVLIFGAGPIGILLAQWARIWGAGKILLADIDIRKLDFARALGFEHVVNPSAEPDVARYVERIAGRGADVVVEASGSSAAFEHCILTARPFGRVVLMGNPAGDMKLSQKAYWAILRRELKLSGTWNSTFSSLPRNEWQLVLEFMASGRLDVRPLITHRVALAELPTALEMMHDRTEFFCKVMYVNNP